MVLKGNFFKLHYAPDWMLYQYHVTYMPPVESRKMKGALLASHSEQLGDVRAFDGTVLYLPVKLPDKVSYDGCLSHKLLTHWGESFDINPEIDFETDGWKFHCFRFCQTFREPSC